MADVLSITSGILNVLDVCYRVVQYLREISAAAAVVQKEIDVLIAEVESVNKVVASIKETHKEYNLRPSNKSLLKASNLESLWGNIRTSLETCKEIATELDGLVREIYGKSGARVTGRIDGLSKESRRRDKSGELRRIRDQLSSQKSNLQILLTGISLYDNRASQDTLDRVSKELRSFDQDFKSQIATLEHKIRFSDDEDREKYEQDVVMLSRIRELRKSVQSVDVAISVTAPNIIFDIPQPVSSFYTGRNSFLETLEDIFLTPSSIDTVPKQLRFVIYGIGGAGKTQFCSKFAEKTRESFWGIFWIDASSHERIKQTFSQIGKYGEVEPQIDSAMHWLSHRKERWLLIIDSADDPRIDLNEYFPKGDRGHILITTRNPAHKIYGNVGPGFFEFQDMDGNEANTLLLRAARQPEPWDADSSLWATKITKQLGFLALALIHAGAAIRNRLCTLKNYLTFYDSFWERIRSKRRSSIDSDNEGDDYMSAHATYELSYHGIEEKGSEASKDAIQLLKIFSFFYYKNIRFDILKRAIINIEIEKVHHEKSKADANQRPLTWHQTYRTMRVSILSFIMSDRSPPVLPYFIRDGQKSGFFDEVRVRYALRELIQMSLITHHESNDSYSMHPLVHKWARERPDMSTPEQCIWSYAAATTLARSILLPPLGDTESDELFRRDILSHIDHVQNCQQALERKIAKNRKPRWYDLLLQWSNVGPMLNPAQSLIYAKFSLVYAQNGRWNDAESLQLAVKKYTDRVLGLDQPSTRRITLALAWTYWNQGRGDEAADLQDTVLQACIKSLGPSSHETLMTMDLLGQTRWQQGNYSQAKMLQKHAVDGLTKLKGNRHEDTLTAMNNLGRTVTRFYENLDEAKELFSQALQGMREVYGPNSLKVLAVREDLAMLALQMDEPLSAALSAVQEVLESRNEKLGKEHAYTLLAMVNLAKIKSALGEHEEAESLVQKALPIAVRNLGEKHIGTLMGRAILGAILVRQSRFAEAETTLLDVIEKQRHLSAYRGDFHPDRLGAMIELAWCYRLQGKLDESIRMCDQTIEGLKIISLKEHPLERKMKIQKMELTEMINKRKDSDHRRQELS